MVSDPQVQHELGLLFNVVCQYFLVEVDVLAAYDNLNILSKLKKETQNLRLA
jgi:hypothetical protein